MALTKTMAKRLHRQVRNLAAGLDSILCGMYTGGECDYWIKSSEVRQHEDGAVEVEVVHDIKVGRGEQHTDARFVWIVNGGEMQVGGCCEWKKMIPQGASERDSATGFDVITQYYQAVNSLLAMAGLLRM